MGTIRFLLAFAVVGAHVGSLPLAIPLGGDTAVQSFYIISGFLIALVWDNKYATQPNGLFLFYTNRAARIYYLYWVVLVISILVALITKYLTKDYPGFFTSPPRGLLLYEIFTNFFIFGSSQAFWLGFDGSLYFTMDYTSSPYPVWRTMTLGPAWTLELELTFYLLAPFLVRRNLRLLVGIVAASFAARLAWYAMGYEKDPWTYRFFPFEIGLFVLGIITYRVWQILAWQPDRRFFMRCSLWWWHLLCFSPWEDRTRLVFVFLLPFAALLPYIFALTRTWKVDALPRRHVVPAVSGALAGVDLHSRPFRRAMAGISGDCPGGCFNCGGGVAGDLRRAPDRALAAGQDHALRQDAGLGRREYLNLQRTHRRRLSARTFRERLRSRNHFTCKVIAGMTEIDKARDAIGFPTRLPHAPDRQNSRRYRAPLVGARDRRVSAIHVRGRCLHRQRRDPDDRGRAQGERGARSNP